MNSVIDWLESTSAKYPNKLAFEDTKDSITWRGLLNKAQIIGSKLIQIGIENKPVAFFMEKSVNAIIGMMGVIYARGFYSFVDLRQPENRMQSMICLLDPILIFSDLANLDICERIFGEKYKVICLDNFIKTDNSIDTNLLLKIRQNYLDTDPLYVNFTSGSTGTPKGVIVSHRSVLDFIPIFTETFNINETDILGNQAPFDFDVSVKDIYSGLYTGSNTLLIPRTYFVNPIALMDYLVEHQVTTLVWAVSAMCFVSIMNGFQYKVPVTVKRVMFSGEVMPVKQLNIWRKYLPKATFVNLYGPTEITCNCTYYFLDSHHDYALNEKIPIGRAFRNEKVFLLDDMEKEISKNKADTVGEICVAGTCLALGYYKDLEKTSESFIQNPLNKNYKETIYRTGDLGKYDNNGNLIYVSRKDFQIKHLGHRIELGEIENNAMACDGVSRACCIYNNFRKKLILYYTGNLEKEEVEKELSTRIPDFMVPNKTIKIDEMPLNKNGKIDRYALSKLYENIKRGNK